VSDIWNQDSLLSDADETPGTQRPDAFRDRFSHVSNIVPTFRHACFEDEYMAIFRVV
jgi:hypothetical protein